MSKMCLCVVHTENREQNSGGLSTYIDIRFLIKLLCTHKILHIEFQVSYLFKELNLDVFVFLEKIQNIKSVMATRRQN